MKDIIYCHSHNDIPKQKHWAIIESSSCWESGYDQDDPATIRNFIGYIAYLDKTQWESEVIARTRKNLETPSLGRPFVAVEVNPVGIKTEISINLG